MKSTTKKSTTASQRPGGRNTKSKALGGDTGGNPQDVSLKTNTPLRFILG